MKRRDAMLLARNISATVLAIVRAQGTGKAEYTLTHAEMEKLSADALEVFDYLVVPRDE